MRLEEGKLFLTEEVDLKRKPHNVFNPHACARVMVGKPKITGISQFHNHITGNAKINVSTITNAANPTILPNFIFISPSFVKKLMELDGYAPSTRPCKGRVFLTIPKPQILDAYV